MKKLLTVLLALFMLLCLVGCESGDSSDTTTTTGDTATTTTTVDGVTTTLSDNNVTTTLGDVTTTTTTKASTTTAATTTTTKATTTTVATTTTTVASYSAFEASRWTFNVIKTEDGNQFCYTYTLILDKDDPRCGESMASPYEEMVPPEYRDEEKPDFEFGGIEWFVGGGGATPLSSVTVSGNTITLADPEGNKLVLSRTSETTVTVVSNAIDILVKAGDVFTMEK